MRSAGGGASAVLPQSLAEQDALHWRDAKFRHFRDEMDSALAQFVYAQEWADLIRYLQRMQRILTKYAQLPVIPDKIAVAKRLFQCLNSSLPSGVHLTTLQTYELIFSRIGAARLARDLAFYTEGIFTLYRHASYQVKPVLLDLFERHFVTLGAGVVPCLPGLVLALLTAMEDVGSEYHARAVRQLDQLARDAPIGAFMSAVWGCLLRNASVRLQALHYLAMRFPVGAAPAAGDDGGRLSVSRAAFCPDSHGGVLRSLVVALQQGDTLVRRTALELLVHHFPLPRTRRAELPQGERGTAAPALLEGAARSAVTDSVALWPPPTALPPPPPLGADARAEGRGGGLEEGWEEGWGGSGEQLFSHGDYTTLLRVALTLLPLREWCGHA